MLVGDAHFIAIRGSTEVIGGTSPMAVPARASPIDANSRHSVTTIFMRFP